MRRFRFCTNSPNSNTTAVAMRRPRRSWTPTESSCQETTSTSLMSYGESSPRIYWPRTGTSLWLTWTRSESGSTKTRFVWVAQLNKCVNLLKLEYNFSCTERVKLPAYSSAALLADSLELVRLLSPPERQRALPRAVLCSRRELPERCPDNMPAHLALHHSCRHNQQAQEKHHERVGQDHSTS